MHLSTRLKLQHGIVWQRCTLAFVLTWVVAGCASTFAPQPLDDPRQFSSYQEQSLAGVRVAMAILTDEEASRHFGVDLGAVGVQALWLRVRNASNQRFWLIRNTVDPDLYSADEVAQLVKGDVSGEQFSLLQQHLRDSTIPVLLEPNTITQGHIFLPREEGGRYVDLRLAGDSYELEEAKGREEVQARSYSELRFGFALTLPDGEFDYEKLDPETLFGDQGLPDLDDEQLRAELEELPCCVSNSDGDAWGDPLNIVLVGDAEDVMNALSRSGWSFTHRISAASVGRMVGAAIGGEGYAVAPISSLYTFGRKQDIALQRARRNIAQRNHMRLWLAPFTHQGRLVWVGQISRDIGVKLSTHSPSLTTHIIDPQVDLTREYLLHSLLAEGLVQRFGFVSGSRVAAIDDPAYNLTDDPYFSDGMRLVVMVASHPLTYGEVRNLRWEESDAPVVQGQSEAALPNIVPIGSEYDD